MKQNLMKNMINNEEVEDNELSEYVIDITDVNNLELAYLTTTYGNEVEYEFVPEYYED